MNVNLFAEQIEIYNYDNKITDLHDLDHQISQGCSRPPQRVNTNTHENAIYRGFVITRYRNYVEQFLHKKLKILCEDPGVPALVVNLRLDVMS